VRLVSSCVFEGAGTVGSIKMQQFPLLLRISPSSLCVLFFNSWSVSKFR